MTTRIKTPSLILTAAMGGLLLLGACGTMAGAGSDISKGGKAIENSANKHAPS